jgi:hypothetical protein
VAAARLAQEAEAAQRAERAPRDPNSTLRASLAALDAMLSARDGLARLVSAAPAARGALLTPPRSAADPPAAATPRLLPRASLEGAAFRRRSGGAHKNRCGKGNSDGSREAFRTWAGLTLTCRSPGCGALVHAAAARRAAKQAGRKHFADGDGCSSRTCARGRHRPRRFAKRQRQWAEELLRAKRLRIAWPQRPRGPCGLGALQ